MYSAVVDSRERIMCWFEAASLQLVKVLKSSKMTTSLWRTVFKKMDVWSKTKPLAGGRKRSETRERSVGGGLCRKKPSDLWAQILWSRWQIWHLHLTVPNTEDFKENEKKKTVQVALSFKDNSQHVQRGRALACLWKGLQIWYRIDNRTYNHKSVKHTEVAYNVWQHSTIHCTRGSLSDNKIQNSG